MNPINLEFFFGILCAILSSRTPRGFLLYLMGAGICILLFFALGGQRGYSVLFGLGVAFLIVPIIQLEYAGRLRAAPWLVFLGNASYSIYLIHNPVVSITSRIAAAVPLLNGWLAAILFSFAISIGCGCIYHLLVERPGLAITRRLMFRKNSQRGEFTLENS